MGDIMTNVDIKSVKLGTQDVKLYLGKTLLYPKTSVQITATSVRPTLLNISSIAVTGQKPAGVQTLNIALTLIKPTLMYIVYPVAWETVQDEEIIRPIIEDSNGFEVGFDVDEDDPTMVYNGVTYRILNIQLGIDTYTILF